MRLATTALALLVFLIGTVDWVRVDTHGNGKMGVSVGQRYFVIDFVDADGSGDFGHGDAITRSQKLGD